MSLGGYKFAGYKCNKGSLSDTAFCLLMHKTRLKAFTEACSKSGANWHFCKNSGTIDFEGKTGVIYDAGGNGYNFISFFQYGDESKYIAIISLPNPSSSIGQNWNYQIGACYGKYQENTVRYAWCYVSMFHIVSMSPFDDTGFLTSGSYPTNALGMVPITHFYLTQSTGLSTKNITGSFYYECYNNNRPIYFGYAIKGSKVISLCSIDKDGTYLTNGYIFPSVMGFDALKLSSQSDQYNLFHANLSGVASDFPEYLYVKKNGWHVNNLTQILRSDGSRYTSITYATSVMFNTTSLANFVYGVSTDMPFSAMRIVTNEVSDWQLRTSGALLNSNGIASKGLIDIDFMACNCTDGYANLKACGAYANGNYLLACKDYGGYQQYYVGWDPSNPDITLDASWEEYTDVV